MLENNPRARILDVAETLFYERGIRAVGVDTLIAEADVAKATFYRHFPTKDLLVETVLRERDTRWRDWLASAVARIAPNPADRPLAIFDALEERFFKRNYRGCAFTNSIIETADPQHPVHATAAAHKRAVTEQVDQMLREAGWSDCDLAPAFVLLIDGAIVTAVREGTPDAAARAKYLARVLLRSKLPRETSPKKRKSPRK